MSSWGISVSLIKAKRVKDALADRGLLNGALRPTKTDDRRRVVFPLSVDSVEDAEAALADLRNEDVDFIEFQFTGLEKRALRNEDSRGKIVNALRALEEAVDFEQGWEERVPKFSWERHGDLLVLPLDPCFKFLSTLEFSSWSTYSHSIFLAYICPGCRRLAVESRVADDGFRTPRVKLVIGDSGVVRHKDNGVIYEYDVLKCMFSSGNVTEKIRVAGFRCEGQVVVDLFAGIGYFTLPYLVHARAEHVYACEWNPDAVDSLKRNLKINGVADRCTVLPGDNRITCPSAVADRVNLGLLPSAVDSYLVAARALKPSRTDDETRWLHVHANVDDNLVGASSSPTQTIHVPSSSFESRYCSPSSRGVDDDRNNDDDVNATHALNQTYENKIDFTCNKASVRLSWFLWACRTRDTFEKLLNSVRSDIDEPSDERQSWNCRVAHVERVKSYGPKVDHLVVDLVCWNDKRKRIEIDQTKMKTKKTFLALLLLQLANLLPPIYGGNVILFGILTKSQLLSMTRIGEILSDDGHNVTIAISVNDVPDFKKSPKMDMIIYETKSPREMEQKMRKEALNMTPMKMLFTAKSVGMPDVLAGRCRGALGDEALQAKMEELKLDLAIVHVGMTCIVPVLKRFGIPYIEFCSVPMFHFACGSDHRVPAPPSYVPDFMLTEDEMTFPVRVLNSLLYMSTPYLFSMMFGAANEPVTEYQKRHGLALESFSEMRSSAVFVMVHGDITFETIRPSIPKIVYIGGVQCDDPKPLEGELGDFIDGASNAGFIVFSLGGALDTDALPQNFVETFLEIFKNIPQRVVWKLKSVPETLLQKVPSNVKIVNWMPQQDLLGHPKAKLFISHGGIQGSFESICHGKPVLGIGLFGDQAMNLRILERKGMALTIEDYKNINPKIVKNQILELLTNPQYYNSAKKAQEIYNDQPLTAAKRLQFAAGYTIRHKGSLHLTSHAAMKLHWVQYYLIDVVLFFVVSLIVTCFLGVVICKKCYRFCCSKSKREKSD